MYHLKYNTFSYNPFVIIDFLILTNEAFKLPEEIIECSNYLQESLDDGGKKYNWLYSMEDPSDYRFIDFCRDEKYGMEEYLCNLDDRYDDFINMIQIWMAFDYIYFDCHSGDPISLIDLNEKTDVMDLYIRQFIRLGEKKNKLCEWVTDPAPIEKRWWLDDDESERFDSKDKCYDEDDKHLVCKSYPNCDLALGDCEYPEDFYQ